MPLPLPLTKCLDPADYAYLLPELADVERVWPAGTDNGQHEHRRWEYAMALHAYFTWQKGYAGERDTGVYLDVGGAGSPFADILGNVATRPRLVDPRVNQKLEDTTDILPYSVDAIFCISTIEHVAAPRSLVRAAHRLLAPNGLLFLTADCWNASGQDTAHFHWMRERIYNPDTWLDLAKDAGIMGFRRFGGSDWAYKGDFVYNYSFISLALTKGVLDV